MTKHHIILAAAVAVTLAACAPQEAATNPLDHRSSAEAKTTTTTEAPSTTTTTRPRPTTTTTTDELGLSPEVWHDVFINTVRTSHPALDSWSDDLITEVARSACDGLDGGLSTEQVLLILLDSFATWGDDVIMGLAYVVGAGIPVFCPQHEGIFDQ